MSLKNAVGGVLLIAGTTIGAAVIALPVDTAHLGFGLSSAYFIVCWFFMTLGAMYVLEANLQVGFGTNLISMAKSTLGLPGQAITWVMYLLLLYSLTAAYLSGAGAWMNQVFQHFSVPLAQEHAQRIGALVVAIGVSALLILGTHTIDLINRVLMVILFAAIISLIITAIPYTQVNLLFGESTTIDLVPLPLIITSFGFAIIVPTLTDYLHGKTRQLRNVILIGSLFPIVLYLLWELVILGLIPQQGETSLLAIQQNGHPATDLPRAIAEMAQQDWLTLATKFFSIFALVTSLLGVTLSLFDFLADGLQMTKSLKAKSLLSAITFIPPLAFILIYPEGFAHVLRFAGIFVCVILGILPALMVYIGRYHSDLTSHTRVFGGKTLIIISMVFFSFIIMVEVLHLLGVNLSF